MLLTDKCNKFYFGSIRHYYFWVGIHLHEKFPGLNLTGFQNKY